MPPLIARPAGVLAYDDDISPSSLFTHDSPRATMRVLSILTTALLPFTALAAKKTLAGGFDGVFAKQVSNGGPIKLDDTAYDALLKGPRDFSVAVLLTALDARFSCQMCTEFQPDWELLAKQWIKGDKKGESRLIYATLDFLDGRNTFQSVRLGLYRQTYL
nr:isoform 3 of magnesium transporter protein 1 [Quercus suber]